MDARVCFIVGGGDLSPDLHPVPAPGDLLIAADAGFSGAIALGLSPDLVIGDFDSLGAPPDRDNVVVLPKIKDDTDSAAAVKLALERGYRRFVLYGCTGGRLAHTLANLQLLHMISQKGGRGFLVGDNTVCTAVTNDTLTFPARMEGYLSVFCAGRDAHGVTLSGLKYTLADAVLTAAFPLGVSNEFIGQDAQVRVADGTLLVLWQGTDVDRALLRRL